MAEAYHTDRNHHLCHGHDYRHLDHHLPMRNSFKHLYTSELPGLGFCHGTYQLFQWSLDSNNRLDIRPDHRKPRLEDQDATSGQDIRGLASLTSRHG